MIVLGCRTKWNRDVHSVQRWRVQSRMNSPKVTRCLPDGGPLYFRYFTGCCRRLVRNKTAISADAVSKQSRRLLRMMQTHRAPQHLVASGGPFD